MNPPDPLTRIADLLESTLAPPNAAALNNGVAWQWDATLFGGGRLRPVPRPRFPSLSDLRGLDEPVAAMSQNIRQFIRGLPANHVLLTGPRGCGKSSIARGVFGAFQGDGLRVVESTPEGLAILPELVPLLSERREKFAVFCDDLSFAESGMLFNRLKSALEGAMTGGDNIIVCATSNRRYLVAERFCENAAATVGDDGEVNPAETTEEKTALFDRFGLWLPIENPDWGEYEKIVRHRLTLVGVKPDAKLIRESRQWAEERGARNGRAARQFAASIAGRNKTKK